MSTADRRLLAREAALATALAASLSALLLWATPPGVDWAAHAYQRAFLVEHGFAIWNNFWYAGRYSFVTYSLIYYPLAALLGIRVLALASIATAALGFSLVVLRQWGPAAKLSSRSFAVLWVGIVGSAAFPFALAIAFALLSLQALQAGRRGRFAVGALLTLAASPLGFLLLAVVGAGALLSRRSLRDVGIPVAAVVVGGAFELVVYRLFGDGGRFPFQLQQLLPALVFCGLGLAVTRGVSPARPLYGLFWIYLVVLVTAYVVPSGIGSNIDRIRYVALPLALVACTLRRWRPLWLVLPAVVLAAIWNATPIAESFARSTSDPESARSYWQPAIAYLHRHLSPSFRVEAVDTAEHWPAAYLPEAGIPIVRGWYRQSDFPQNELLYDQKLGPATYERWLRGLGVRYVVLSDAAPDYSAQLEARLVRSGATTLEPVYRSRHVTVYQLPHATPIVTGPAPASVVWMWPTRVVLDVQSPGEYRVALRWSPYWHTYQGCVAKGRDGMVRVDVRHAGLVDLSFALSVHRGLDALAGIKPAGTCG
ncbi:MAG TPA: hypothetical protein VFA19_04325 [Gaiellaceae bacterium]|nr:hypothetical protein [Gaiellaceae bacterium]